MNTLLCVDVYKMSHMLQYPEDTTEIYSYMEARKPGEVVFFGLQYLLIEYLTKPITVSNAEEFIKYYEMILGPAPSSVRSNVYRLANLGYWPVEIKAIPEGTVINNGNALLTIRNTLPEFAWCVGFLESFLLKLWNPCTVAACSRKYRQLVSRYAGLTCDDDSHLPFAVHDFGYRGVSSEETAAISGGAHLLNFLGSDTVPAVAWLDKYYLGVEPIALSVPASEHSVMCSYGRENEDVALDRMLDLYPEGIVSIVSDTYNLWRVLTEWLPSRKDKILARPGKVVLRPDSGNPVDIICGTQRLQKEQSPMIPVPGYLGCLDLLDRVFGHTISSKGYKVLNPQVGLIYGDGMYYDRFVEMLQTMKEQGWASSNLVIGVGGLLLQQHSRDEFGFAIKATRIKRGDIETEIYKDPVTDPGKRSKKGLMMVDKQKDGTFITFDQVSEFTEKLGALQTVFKDGRITKLFHLKDIRSRCQVL